MIPEAPPKAALYVRVSTTRQAEAGISIEDQIARLSSRCREKGWQIAETYEDAGHSAKTLNRPALERLLADAARKPKPFDFVLAIDNTRVSRVNEQFLAVRTLLAKNQISLTCLNLPEGEGPEAELVAGIMASVSQFENAQRARRVQQCLQTNAKNGYWNGGCPPFGYQIVEVTVAGKSCVRKQLEIDPKEADVVRRIYGLRLNGADDRGPLGVCKIAQELSDLKIPNRSGNPWSVQAVHTILRRTTYVGRHPYRLFNPDGASEKNTELREITFMPCPAIIDRALFDKVQACLDDADAKITPARLTSGSLMLTGLLHCASCGAMMHIVTGKGGQYRYYTCGRRHRTAGAGCSMRKVALAQIETAVTDALLSLVLGRDRVPAFAAAVHRAMEESKAPAEAELRSKQAALNESGRRLKKILDCILDARGTTLKHLENRLKEQQAAHDRLQEEAAILRGRVRERVAPIRVAQYPALAALFTRSLKDGPLPLRQGIARLLIERIDFDGSTLNLVPKRLGIGDDALPTAA